jgi:hypothetical protein
MYHRAADLRAAPPVLDRPAGAGPEAAARLAVSRARQAMTGRAAGPPPDPARLRRLIASSPPETGREAECALAVGWLHWLEGCPAAAEPALAEAAGRARLPAGAPLLAEAAYWLGRACVLLGRPEAAAEYEVVLRGLKGDPQAIAWFVDLLWRSGKVDRAEQVWRSVRGNKRVMACDEGPLLEARALLRRGEAAPAERLLTEAAPQAGAVRVERQLLLAWALTALRHYDKARAAFGQAEGGAYPAAALAAWRALLEKRRRGEPAGPDDAGRAPPALADLLRGCQAVIDGRADDAAAAFRLALAQPAAQPFARYTLARLGHDDPAAVLAQQPGLFLAVRCRAWAALDRFRQRQATPAELLDALQQAASAGWRSPAAEHFRRLAQALQQKQPTADEVRGLAAEPTADPAARRNLFRAALELAARRLPPAAAAAVLREWAGREWPAEDAELGRLVGRQLLRLSLSDGLPPHRQPLSPEGRGEEEAAFDAVARLLPGDPAAALAREWIVSGSPLAVDDGEAALPAARLWRAARTLAAGGALTDDWRDRVRGAPEAARGQRGYGRLRAAAQALLLVEAAGRGDAAAFAALLEDVDCWRGFRPAPPRFAVAAVAAAVAAQPGHAAWRRALPRWLSVWGADALGPAGATLAAQGGLAPAGDAADAPAGAPAAPWFLHQAARALGRDDAPAALAYVRRALAADPELASVPDAAVACDALPELERRAHAQALANAARPDDAAPAAPAALLADAVDLLAARPDGPSLLEAAGRGDRAAVRNGLAALADQPDLPPRLAHHLALLEMRSALSLEEGGRAGDAEPHWQCAWGFWLRLLAADEPARDAVLDHLLAGRRRRVADLLARDAVDEARRCWALVQDLPAAAGRLDEAFGRGLADRVARFRDDLATEYLLATREAMRYGAVPEGFHADYDKGLAGLRRLLSLDRDNPRLLTALVEVCGEFFLDLYNAGDPRRLAEQVERYTPFATQLARLAEGRPGDLAARAALADFYKFRGFVSPDRGRKAELYREALRFDPGNDNVRQLLADLGEPADPPPAPPKEDKSEPV